MVLRDKVSWRMMSTTYYTRLQSQCHGHFSRQFDAEALQTEMINA